LGVRRKKCRRETEAASPPEVFGLPVEEIKAGFIFG